MTGLAGITAGNGKIFRVSVTVKPGWNKMDVVMKSDLDEGVKAIGCRIVDSGAVAYIPPFWAVTEVEGDEVRSLKYYS